MQGDSEEGPPLCVARSPCRDGEARETAALVAPGRGGSGRGEWLLAFWLFGLSVSLWFIGNMESRGGDDSKLRHASSGGRWDFQVDLASTRCSELPLSTSALWSHWRDFLEVGTGPLTCLISKPGRVLHHRSTGAEHADGSPLHEAQSHRTGQ